MSRNASTCFLNMKYVPNGSAYKYVRKRIDPNGDIHWFMCLDGTSAKEYDTEREAAIAVDKALLNQGRQPVNILVKKE